MINFYPGPSKIDSDVKDIFIKAIESKVVEVNHRSNVFMSLYEELINNLRVKWGLPPSYQVLFFSSATECWEVVLQSFNKNPVIITGGAFSDKWFEYSTKLKKCISINVSKVENYTKNPELIFLVQNETSNGTQIPNEILNTLRNSNPDSLIVADVTSSLGGQYLDFTNADIWFASVQKCIGLPPGLAIMFVSERAKVEIEKENTFLHYNDLVFSLQNANKFQTTHTPNTLLIYSLNELIKIRSSIKIIDEKIKNRMKKLRSFFNNETSFELLIDNTSIASETVLCLKNTVENIKECKKLALENDILLGNGYGNWKNNTIRIANFPAINDVEINILRDFFLINYPKK